MNDYFYPWLAGFVDGEGCLGVYNYTHSPSCRITISNTNLETILYIKKYLGGRKRERRLSSAGEKRKPVYQLCFTGKDAQAILKLIYPYLITKHEQAKLLLSMNFNKSGECKRLTTEEKNKRNIIQMRIKKLNHRGI